MSTLLAGDITEYPGDVYNSSGGEDFCSVLKFTAVASGTVTDLSMWVTRLSLEFTSAELVVYADDAGTPGALIALAEVSPPTVSPGVNQWITGSVVSGGAIVAGQSYWLGVEPHGGNCYFPVSPDTFDHDFWSSFSEGAPSDPFNTDPDSFFEGTNNPGFQVLGDPAVDRRFDSGLVWHVTGLWYPDAESVPYYGQITDPQDDSVTIPLCDSRLGQVTVSAWDPVVTDMVFHSYARMLKVYYHGILVFWGPFKLASVDSQKQTVTFDAVDPSIRAIRHYLRRDDIDGDLSAANDDKATVTIDGDGLRLLLDAARNIPAQTARGCPDIGIDAGTDTSTAAPSALMGVSRGDEVWNSIVQLSQSLGPDFELHPTETIPGAYCELLTTDRQGTDKSAQIQLHYGCGLDNLDDLSFTEGSEYVTHAHVLSRDGLRVTAVDVEASAETGQYTAWDSTDYDAQRIPVAQAEAVLGAYGRAVINAYGRPLIVLTLTLPVETEDFYLYVHDYTVGDTIDVAGKIGLITLEAAPYRITQVKLNGANGRVRPEVQVVSDRVGGLGDTVNSSEES